MPTPAAPERVQTVPEPSNRPAPPPPRKRGLRTKFGLSVTLLLTLTILGISLFALRGEQKALRQEMIRRGITIARNLALNAEKPLLNSIERLSLMALVKVAMENPSVTYAIIVDEKGLIAAHPDVSVVEKETPYQRPVGVEELGDAPLKISEPFQFKDGKNIDIALPILLNNQARIGEVHVGLSQTQIEQTIQATVKQIALLALAFILAGILVTAVLVSIIVRPIKALEAGANIIGRGNLDYQIKVASQDEIGNLARTFNQMTQDLKQAQVKIIEKEKMEQELETARKIQAVLLPKENPNVEGFQITSFYKAAREVGGDYFDFLWPTKKSLALVVADVSGKGVPGSLGMVMTRSILRSQAQILDAAETLRRTNSLLFKDIKRGMFVTMFYVVLDAVKRTLNCANAGHNPLILGHPDGRVELFNPAGIALGLDAGDRFNAKMRSQDIALKSGDVFILYTDGITEAMSPKNEEFTEERLAQTLGKHVRLGAKEISDSIVNELMTFAAGAPQHDDITLLTVKAL